jgi:flagellar motility protein MotE (MotC chaperone)
MRRLLREFRLIPVVLFATISLFALKTIGLLVEGHYTLDDGAYLDDDSTGTIPGTMSGPARGPAAAGKPAGRQAGKPSGTQSWAQEMLGYPDVTGATPAPKPAQPKDGAPKAKPAEAAAEEPTGRQVPLPPENGRLQSPAETAILERLQARRAELEARAKELEMRESLLNAAEKRLEGRIAELKDLEARVNSSVQKREEGDASRLKNIVTMYENMKAKDAAKIFDRLDLKILVEVATLINPRRMSDILAQMQPDMAQQLTVELAARSPAKDGSAELPKIEGKPAN